MNSSRLLNSFSLSFYILGINRKTDPDADQKFLEEIKHRPHLRIEAITFQKEILFINLTAEGPNKETTSRQIAEELFEISNAILNEVEGLRVEIIENNT